MPAFQGYNILPKLQFVGSFSLLTSHPTRRRCFFPWNPFTVSKKHTQSFRDMFNIHKMKFCLKSTYENTTSSSLKALMLEAEQSPGSFLYCCCHFFPLLRWHCASLDWRRSKQLLTSGSSCGCEFWKQLQLPWRLPHCLEFQL